MLHDSTQKLIQKLWELSARGEIPWRAGGDNTWVFDTEGYVVAVRDEPSELRILRHDGREIERAEADQLTRTRLPAGGGHYAGRIAELVQLARARESEVHGPMATNGSIPATHPPQPADAAQTLPPHQPGRSSASALFGAIPSFVKNRQP